MIAWGFLGLSIACSLVIAALLKFAESRGMRTMYILVINYLFATVTAFSTGNMSELSTPGLLPWLIMAAILGVGFIGNFFMLSKSIDKNGIGISLAMMRLSLVIPIVLAALVYGEVVKPLHAVGIVVAIMSLILLINPWSDGRKAVPAGLWLLGGVFLVSGMNDFGVKIFETDVSGMISENVFMGLVFLVALVSGVVFLIAKEGNPRIGWKEAGLGLAVGIPNLYSTVFLIRALAHMDVSVAFSVANISIVLGGAVMGMVFWNDKLKPVQFAGMVLAFAALIILVN